MLMPSYLDREGVPIFMSSDIDELGTPESNGWISKYFVVDDTQTKMVPSYEQEMQLREDTEKRKDLKLVHRYCRKSRFRTCLFQLLGKIGFVGKSKLYIEDLINEQVGSFEKNYMPPDEAWEFFRKILKDKHKQSFYNRIPAMVRMSGMLLDEKKYGVKKIQSILVDFDIMDNIFPQIKKNLKRQYFPSLRFTCLMLMARNNVIPPIAIPLARTKSKGETLKKDFDEIWDEINKVWTDYIFN